MSDQRRFRLRVTYRLAGRLANLSHLEVTHTLERIVRRSGLPFALTCGFSPHMRLSFGSALPVGVGSECEVLDLYLTAYVPPSQALERLQQASPADMQPTTCAYVEEDAPKASCAFPLSAYEVRLSEPIERLIVPESITVVRKKKERELLVKDFLRGEPVCQGDAVRIVLESKETGSLRVDVLIDACLAELERASGRRVSVRSITRIEQGC